MKRFKAELILFLVASIWAGTFPVVKNSLDTIPPYSFIGIRFAIGGVLFGILFYRKINLTDIKVLKAGIVLGILQTIGFASQTIGMLYTTASNSALITGVTILIVPFAQFILTKKSVKGKNWLSVFVVVIGLFLLTQAHINGINKGDLITIICAFAWAFYIISVDVYTNKYDINSLIFIQIWITAIICIAIGAAAEDISQVKFTQSEVLSLLYMGIAATLITTFLLNTYQRKTTPVRASIIYTWEQPAAVMLSILFLNERLSIIQYIGGAIMITGILFSETFEYFKSRYRVNRT